MFIFLTMFRIQGWTPFGLLLFIFSLNAQIITREADLHRPGGDFVTPPGPLVGESTPHLGHLKPFGSVGPFQEMDEVNGHIDPIKFFQDYVHERRPLKMKSAAQSSPAFRLWTDEYLKNEALMSPEQHIILIETAKKENRSGLTRDVDFKDFMEMYHHEQIYMVNTVPPFLRKDIIVPGPLQCQPIYKGLIAEMLMWMSSGGTSSVIHTDSVDNIICVLSGHKSLVLVDPDKYPDKVDIDHPEGAYSGIDVDRVDYVKYPSLADIEYHVVNVSAGDCLYIPFKWVHQVRSFRRNIAVNIWWNHHRCLDLDLHQCTTGFSHDITLEDVDLHGFPPITEDLDNLRDYLLSFIRKELSLSEFIQSFSRDVSEQQRMSSDEYQLPLKQIFLLIDSNSDKKVSPREVDLVSSKDWDMIGRQLDRFEAILEDEREREEVERRIAEKIAERKKKREL